MLSAALKSSTPASSTPSLSNGLASSSNTLGLLDGTSSTYLSSLEDEQQLNSIDDHCLDTPKSVKGDADDEPEPFWAVDCPTTSPTDDQRNSVFDALCRQFSSSTLSDRPSFERSTTLSSTGLDIRSGSSSSNPCPPMMARSCPKPIIMPRRGRQVGLSSHQEELSVFVPPHELAASSLLDPTNVSESLVCKGSAALRLRHGVLRRTGYLEGHTEVLRPTARSPHV